MYRPEGWTGHGELTIEQIKAMAKDEIFEAGADALLEGLKRGSFISGESLRNIRGATGWGCISPKSKWYCIPEEVA